MTTQWTGRTKPETSWLKDRVERWKEYLVGKFTDWLFYNITDEDWNRIIIYDSTWFEQISNTDYSGRTPANTTRSSRTPI